MVRAILAATSAWALCSADVLALTLTPDEAAAREVALQWLQLADSGKYQQAAVEIAEQVRDSQRWLSYFAAHRAPVGRVNKRQIVEIKHASTIPGAPDVRNYDVIRFKTSFERKPVAMEEVVLAKMGCCWEVSGYKID